MVQSPLPLVNSLVTGSVSLAANSMATSARMALKSEELLEEIILTMRAARPVIEAVGEAIEAGLLDDINELLSTVSETQDDVRAARDAVERLVGLVNTTLEAQDPGQGQGAQSGRGRHGRGEGGREGRRRLGRTKVTVGQIAG
jgi:predicted DNA-binding protein